FISAAARSKPGAMAWQGPHQSAQKSTTTGSSVRTTAASKLASLTATGLPFSSGVLHLPQVGPSATRSAGTRFKVAQLGQPINTGYKSVPDPDFSSSRPAPVPDDRLVHRHRLADALHAAPFVGLVRHLRLAGAEHDGRRAGVDLEQVRRVGHVACGARLGPRAQVRFADVEDP